MAQVQLRRGSAEKRFVLKGGEWLYKQPFFFLAGSILVVGFVNITPIFYPKTGMMKMLTHIISYY